MTLTEPLAGTQAPLVVTDDGPLRLLTLNRPAVRNAIDLATALAIEAAIDEYEARSDLRALIITGAGGTFCAGMDLKAFLRGERPSTQRRGFAGLVELPPTKPVIAAVEGQAVAGGFEIILACDLIVAADNAWFALPEVKRGLVAAGGGLLRLPQRLPFQRAVELALTGERLQAVDAERYGLVNRLTTPGQALTGARALAELVAANGPLAVAATKQILHESRHWPAAEAFHRQRELSEPVRRSDDAREGARAFLEKRAPVWNGN
jgi:enoyl-CoA hydratase